MLDPIKLKDLASQLSNLACLLHTAAFNNADCTNGSAKNAYEDSMFSMSQAVMDLAEEIRDELTVADAGEPGVIENPVVAGSETRAAMPEVDPFEGDKAHAGALHPVMTEALQGIAPARVSEEKAAPPSLPRSDGIMTV